MLKQEKISNSLFGHMIH